MVAERHKTMNIKVLEYMIALAEEKSISRAAQKLYITQPALSLFLSRLEDSLKTELFKRTSNGLVLTYSGERYIEMAKKVLSIYADFETELLNISTLSKGHLSIGTSPHIGSLCLPKILPLYQKRYPNIGISITEGNSQVLEHKLASSKLDIALLHLPFKELEPAGYEVIAQDRYVMAFARNHWLTRHLYHKKNENYPFVDPTMIKNEKFVLAFPYQRVRQISDRILRNAGITEPEIVLTTSSVQTALRFASAGMGITFLPESYIQLFRCAGNPVFCYMEDRFQASWTFVIAFSKSGIHSLPAKSFAEMTKNNY